MKGKYYSAILICAMATSAHAAPQHTDFVVAGGCTVRAKAYVEKNYRGEKKSRYDLDIIRTQKDTYNWDFTLPGENQIYHYDNAYSNTSEVPYGSKTQTTVRAILHQYDIYEERVTFRNLVLGPTAFTANSQTTPRFLLLKEPVTVTTPSGISITLPVQGADTFQKVFANFNGNANALFIQIETSPDQREVFLPGSPLCKKLQKPASIKLECANPNFLVSYLADNTYKSIGISIPNLATTSFVSELTLIVRQRVDLQSIPIIIEVPISRG